MNLTAGIALQNGKYVLGSPLGQSNLGVTLKATQVHLNQTVILKTLNQHPDTDIAHLRQPFLDEARRFAKCQHPGLVRVLDLFEESGLPFVVMDYVAGQSLAEVVKQGPLPEAEALHYIRQAGSALSVLHRSGLVHRDVKPENLLRPQGADFVVLVDFGIAHSAVLGAAEPPIVPASQPYAPIEYYSQASLTPASDIYGLSATLYFLLTGQPPVAAPLRQSPLTKPRQLQSALSPAVEAAILRGMEMNAQARPQSIAAWFGLLPDQSPVPTPSSLNGASAPTVIELPKTPASANGAAPVIAPQPTPSSRSAARSVAPAPTVSPPALVRRSRLAKVLVMASAIAASIGLGLGLALRFSAVNGIGPSLFQTKQFFPSIEGWPKAAESVAAPIVPLSPEPPMRTQRAPAPLPRAKAVPSPVPLPELQPLPEPSVEVSPVPEPSPTESIAPAPPAENSAPLPAPAPSSSPEVPDKPDGVL